MGKRTTYSYEPDYAVPPGYTLEDTLEAMGMTQKELAARTSLTEQTITRIIHGKQPITAETANRLEMVTGVDASMWNGLEARYRERLAKLEDAQKFAQDVAWLDTIPIDALIKRNVIPNTKDKGELVKNALSFFGVSNVSAFQSLITRKGIAARKSTRIKSDPGALAAWLRLGEIRANKADCAPYDKARFVKVVHEIRKLTVEDPEVFVPQMVNLCRDSGVALILEPEIPKAPWYGASYWINPKKAMILLNLRGKREDQFWFSFFHETAHIIHDNRDTMCVSDGDSYTSDPVELRANEFAANLLIPESFNTKIAQLKSDSEVKEIANEIGVSTGIVVGRFRFLTKRFTMFHNLNTTFVWGNPAQQAG
jgi:HTH-type transcriptional regulator / antitoxin HigA